jgi:hypothetical protein
MLAPAAPPAPAPKTMLMTLIQPLKNRFLVPDFRNLRISKTET